MRIDTTSMGMTDAAFAVRPAAIASAIGPSAINLLPGGLLLLTGP